MTFLFNVEAGRDVHPVAAESPDPLPSETLQIPAAIVAAATPIWLASRFFRRTRPWTFCGVAGYSTVVIYALHFENLIGERKRVLPFLKANNIEPKPFKLWENNGKFESGDAVVLSLLGGALAGLLTKAPFISKATGWTRVVGMSSVFAGTNILGLAATAREDVMKAMIQSNQHYTQRRSLLQPQPVSMNADSSVMESLGVASTAPSTMPLGSKPHLVLTDDHDTVPLLPPVTDYLWRPDSNAEQELLDYMGKIQNDRDTVAAEAEYLWIMIAEKEDTLFYKTSNAKDDEKADRLRNELTILGTIHNALWGKVAELDWLLADCRKILKRVRGERYIPEPRNDAIRSLEPTFSLGMIQAHMAHIHEMRTGVDEIGKVLSQLTESQASQLHDGVRDSLRKDRESIQHEHEALLRIENELEKRMEENRVSNDENKRSSK